MMAFLPVEFTKKSIKIEKSPCSRTRVGMEVQSSGFAHNIFDFFFFLKIFEGAAPQKYFTLTAKRLLILERSLMFSKIVLRSSLHK